MHVITLNPHHGAKNLPTVADFGHVCQQGQGRHDAQVGPSVVSVFPSPDIVKDPLVEPHDGDVNGAALNPPVLQDHCVDDRPNKELALPGPSRGSPPDGSVLSLDNDLQSFLAAKKQLWKGKCKCVCVSVCPQN